MCNDKSLNEDYAGRLPDKNHNVPMLCQGLDTYNLVVARVKIVEQNLNNKMVIQYYMMLRTLDPGGTFRKAQHQMDIPA